MTDPITINTLISDHKKPAIGRKSDEWNRDDRNGNDECGRSVQLSPERLPGSGCMNIF